MPLITEDLNAQSRLKIYEQIIVPTFVFDVVDGDNATGYFVDIESAHVDPQKGGLITLSNPASTYLYMQVDGGTSTTPNTPYAAFTNNVWSFPKFSDSAKVTNVILRLCTQKQAVNSNTTSNPLTGNFRYVFALKKVDADGNATLIDTFYYSTTIAPDGTGSNKFVWSIFNHKPSTPIEVKENEFLAVDISGEAWRSGTNGTCYLQFLPGLAANAITGFDVVGSYQTDSTKFLTSTAMLEIIN
mgnify:CR=1 FL=1